MRGPGLFGLSSLHKVTSNIKNLHGGSPNKTNQNKSAKNFRHFNYTFYLLNTFSFVQGLAVEKEAVPLRNNSQNAPWCVPHLGPLLIKDTYAFSLFFKRAEPSNNSNTQTSPQTSFFLTVQEELIQGQRSEAVLHLPAGSKLQGQRVQEAWRFLKMLIHRAWEYPHRYLGNTHFISFWWVGGKGVNFLV